VEIHRHGTKGDGQSTTVEREDDSVELKVAMRFINANMKSQKLYVKRNNVQMNRMKMAKLP
jgi:hypothetical protein